jgi:hypothetical protein
MAGRIVPEASISLSLLGKNLDAAGIVADPVISEELQAAMIAFANAIQQFSQH